MIQSFSYIVNSLKYQLQKIFRWNAENNSSFPIFIKYNQKKYNIQVIKKIFDDIDL